LILWKPEYSVGIQELDKQHQYLIKLYNDLSTAVERGNVSDSYDQFLIRKLELFALFYFTSEEHMMEIYGYPDLEDHRKEHEGFISRLNGFKEISLEYEITLAEEIRDFLKEWIVKHSLEKDEKYGQFVSDKMSQ